MNHQLITLLLLLYWCTPGQAQRVPCSIATYETLKASATELVRQGQYKQAIAKYTSAKTCRPEKTTIIDQEIARVFELVDQERVKAILNERRAVASERQAIRERDRAESRRKAAEANRIAALSSNVLFVNKNTTDALQLARLAWDTSRTDAASRALAEAYYSLFAGGCLNYATLAQHREAIHSVVVSPDEQLILSGSQDGTAKLWDREGKMIANLVHGKAVKAALFTPDGQSILTYGIGGRIKTWDLNGRLLHEAGHHSAAITAVALSSDGRWIASTAEDRTTVIRDRQNSAAPTLIPDEYTFEQLVFSPDDRYVLARRGGELRIWDLHGRMLVHSDSLPDWRAQKIALSDVLAFTRTRSGVIRWIYQGRLQRVFPTEFRTTADAPINQARYHQQGRELPAEVYLAHDYHDMSLLDLSDSTLASFESFAGPLRSLAVSPAGDLILAGSADQSVQLWNLQGKLVTSIQEQLAEINSVAFSPDGQYLLTASSDRTAKLWDLKGNLVANLDKHTDEVEEAFFFQSGDLILTRSKDNTIRLWRLGGQLVKNLEHAGGYASTRATFSPDGKHILTYSGSFGPPTLKLWDREGRLIASLDQHQASLTRARFSASGRYILSSSQDGTAKLWDRSGRLVRDFDQHNTPVENAIISHDETMVLTISGTYSNYYASIWDVTDGSLISTLPEVTYAIFSPDDQQILSRNGGQQALLRSLDGTLISDDIQHSARINFLHFSPDGNYLLSSANDPEVKVWDRRGKLLTILDEHTGAVWAAIFSPDGRYILTNAEDGTAKLWTPGGRLVTTFSHQNGTVTDAKFSPSNQLILTQSEDNSVKVWDLSGKPVGHLQQHTGTIFDASFSPDDQYIVTSSGDNTAKLWSVSGKLLANFYHHKDLVADARFSPDSKFLLTASSDGTAKIWPLPATIYGYLNQQPAPLPALSEAELIRYGVR